MLTKTITYTDYNGVQRKETFNFNLNKAELMEMQMGTTGGYTAMIEKIIETQDLPALINIFKDLVLKSYGVKSDDGKRFIKSAKLSEEFSQTEAYVELYMELATNAEKAAEFANGIIPQELVEQAEAQKAALTAVD